MEKVIVIIPVYNEEKYLPLFIKDLTAVINRVPSIKQVIFIDDGSKDRTGRLILENKNSKFILMSHTKNKGKGEAMKTGLREAVKRGANKVIFMDGDHQHEPKYLSDFINPLDNYKIVFGYRNLGRDVPYLRKLGNQVARLVAKTFFHINRRDLLCGFMSMRKDLFETIHWSANDYGVEAEISAIIGRLRINFAEVNIRTIYLDKRKGVNLFHAFFILMKIPYWYFKY